MYAPPPAGYIIKILLNEIKYNSDIGYFVSSDTCVLSLSQDFNAGVFQQQEYCSLLFFLWPLRVIMAAYDVIVRSFILLSSCSSSVARAPAAAAAL